jgi:hypothetical protein
MQPYQDQRGLPLDPSPKAGELGEQASSCLPNTDVTLLCRINSHSEKSGGAGRETFCRVVTAR